MHGYHAGDRSASRVWARVDGGVDEVRNESARSTRACAVSMPAL